jgi:predicted alpha/beta superfamily hydrolase
MEVSLERTEIRKIHSRIVGQEYELLISLPYSYENTNEDFPVIFLLDPYRAFAMNKGFTDVLAAPFKIIPEVILVGIGYGGEDLNARLNYAVGRVRDYTPAQDSYTEERYEELISDAGIAGIDLVSGQASAFLGFIKTELIPFIDSIYRIDNGNKMLSGYSFGGTFAMYSLLTAPELFDKYFIGSPSLGFKDRILFEYESKYSEAHNDLNARVFISVGENERSYAENREMIDSLISRNYSSLELIEVSFSNEGHTSCYPAAMSRGLIELYKNDD